MSNSPWTTPLKEQSVVTHVAESLHNRSCHVAEAGNPFILSLLLWCCNTQGYLQLTEAMAYVGEPFPKL